LERPVRPARINSLLGIRPPGARLGKALSDNWIIWELFRLYIPV